MPDFDQSKPPLDQTNPPLIKNGPPRSTPGAFPAHVYKFAPKAGLVVGWDGDRPVFNDFAIVADADALAAKEVEGFTLAPQLKAPKK